MLCIVILAGYFLSRPNITLPGKPAVRESGCKAVFIDVGQGDSCLLICDGETVLIDTGEYGSFHAVSGAMERNGVHSLDYVFITHPHSDHMGSFAQLCEEYEIKRVVMPDIPDEFIPEDYPQAVFSEAVSSSQSEKIICSCGDRFYIGGGEFTVIAPTDTVSSDLNGMSMVARFDYGETSFLFTGDCTCEEESDIISSGADIDCDVLKVSHHGSDYSSSLAFLSAVTPEVAVISVGEDNSYGHPASVTIRNLERFTDEIYRTDICSDITVDFDETAYTVSFYGN